MSTLTELKNDILASLQSKSTTFDELMQRSFLKNISPYGVSILLQQLERDGLTVEKKETYSVTKKGKAHLIKKGYEV